LVYAVYELEFADPIIPQFKMEERFDKLFFGEVCLKQNVGFDKQVVLKDTTLVKVLFEFKILIAFQIRHLFLRKGQLQMKRSLCMNLLPLIFHHSFIFFVVLAFLNHAIVWIQFFLLFLFSR